MSKRNGAAAERELLHMFCNKGYSAIRVAGSGSSSELSCDLLVGNGNLMAAIECKATRSNKKYITNEQIADFKTFSQNFGLAALVAIKFSRNGWWFIHPDEMESTGKNIAISLEDIRVRGKSFDALIEQFPKKI